MKWVIRHYAAEGLFIFPTFLVVIVVIWLAKRFAWSDETISAVIIAWLVPWFGVVFLFSDRILDSVVGVVFRRTKDR